jgi:methyl-accepting chemotaxis protein
MRDQLSEAHALQAVENWTNTGLAKMNDVLKSEAADVTTIADEILSLMVRYVKVNQGALYLLEGEGNDQYLERVATYAYAKRKFIEQRINIGQGLVGQCVLEKSTMILTQLPKDYIRITSGLGEALPGFVVILPLKIQERVMGALELASFEALKKHEVAFLEKIAENIASLLSSRKTAAVTLQLLNDARLQTQKLAAQEEEIRQNAEEMRAIQEQMLCEKLLLEKEVAILKARIDLDARETDLESQESDPFLLRDNMSFR